MDFIRRNFGLKVWAVIIAVVLWFSFNHLGRAQPIYSKTLELPLGVHGVAAGFVPSTPAKKVTVEFAGPQSTLDQISSDEFSAYVDCRGKAAGLYSLPVAVVGPNEDAVRSINPAQVVVTVDRYAYRSVPVVAASSGAGAPQLIFDPKAVTVAGAQSLVVQVFAAAVSAPPRGEWKNGAADAKATAVDAKLAPIAGVTVAPPYVRVAIAGRRQPGRR